MSSTRSFQAMHAGSRMLLTVKAPEVVLELAP